MTINNIQSRIEDSPSNNTTKFTFLRGAQIVSSGLAFYCGMQLLNSALPRMKELFCPDLLSFEEKIDLDQENLEWEIADLRADCVGPLEVAEFTFVVMCYLSKLIKINKLCSMIGLNQTIKKKLVSMKDKLLSPFSTRSTTPNRLAGFRILEEIDSLDEFVRQELANREKPKNPIEIATAALDVVNLVVPYPAITSIVETGKIFSELTKSSQEKNKLDVPKKTFHIAGRASKAIAEFTPVPIVGKVFAHAALATGSLLKIVDQEQENAA